MEIKYSIGILPIPITASGQYLLSLIQQQGILYSLIEEQALQKPQNLPPIILILESNKIIEKDHKSLLTYMQNGGCILTFSVIESFLSSFGCQIRPTTLHPYPTGTTTQSSLGEGFLHVSNPFIQEEFPLDWFPLHGFGCCPVVSIDGNTTEILANYEPRTLPKQTEQKLENPFWPAITLHRIGNGWSLFFAVDLVLTIRIIQEGRYIDSDGIPPADGTAPIDDQILKCEDGLVLDWINDRRNLLKNVYSPAFTIPVADIWKSLITKCIELLMDHSIKKSTNNLQRVWFWPDGIPYICLLSHDTDGNNEKQARKLLNRLVEYHIQSTWCLIPPGYSPKFCQEITEAGFELGFHFDVQTFNLPDSFTLETLQDQLAETREQTHIIIFYSNKNHYTRWEGRVDFFEWCEQVGIKVDQSKGSSKAGTMGFPFGSCMPWQAQANDGHIIDCLEIGFQSQDPGLMGPAEIIAPIQDACAQVHGIAHFIFHPAHVDEVGPQRKLKEFIEYAQAHGGHFMTSQQIGEWWRARNRYISTGGKGILPHAVIQIYDISEKKWKKTKMELTLF